MNIFLATIRIDIDDYIKGITENPGYIDGSNTFLEASENTIVSTCSNLDEAEDTIDRTVYLNFMNSEIEIKYEFIEGREEIYFNKVNFMGSTYPVSSDMKSLSCYCAIMEYIRQNNKSLFAQCI